MSTLKPELYSPWHGMDRCPHCGIASPNMANRCHIEVDGAQEYYVVVQCQSCKHCTMMRTTIFGSIQEVWPSAKTYSSDIPERARKKLMEAQGTLGFPSPSILCSCAAIDWMLKAKGYTQGNLFPRIERAASDHVITEDMKAWAHEVRLGANAERHADMDEPEPTREDAERLLKFAEALAEILFELPARVQRGRAMGEDGDAS